MVYYNCPCISLSCRIAVLVLPVNIQGLLCLHVHMPITSQLQCVSVFSLNCPHYKRQNNESYCDNRSKNFSVMFHNKSNIYELVLYHTEKPWGSRTNEENSDIGDIAVWESVLDIYLHEAYCLDTCHQEIRIPLQHHCNSLQGYFICVNLQIKFFHQTWKARLFNRSDIKEWIVQYMLH